MNRVAKVPSSEKPTFRVKENVLLPLAKEVIQYACRRHDNNVALGKPVDIYDVIARSKRLYDGLQVIASATPK